MRGENTPSRTCVQCGEQYAPTGEFRTYARRFCSRACTAAHNSARQRAAWPSAEEVRHLYEVERLSDRDLGARFGHSYQWAYTVRKAYGIAGRPTNVRSAAKEARPTLQANGYVKLGDRWLHRVVMAEKVGRPLVEGETVHHVDGDPTNNDPRNLVLYPTHSEHMWDERGRNAKSPTKGAKRSKRRDWTEAREKVEAEGRCRVCARTGIKLDAAHIIPRSRVAAGSGEHPDNIVPLCHERCHPAFDARELDLLPFLTLGEQGYAVALVGLMSALRRVSNNRWIPEERAA